MMHLTAATLMTALMIVWMPAENVTTSPSREVAVLQTCLQAMNLAPGAVDGVPGPRTKAAVERWTAACFGAKWEEKPLAFIAISLEAECHAALYKTEVPINYRCPQ